MKKYLLGIFAVVLAVGFSAFTVDSKNAQVAPTNATFADVWYEYIGPQPPTDANLKDPANWRRFDPQPPDIRLMCAFAVRICAVLLPDNAPIINPAQVVINQEFANSVQTAITNGVETSTIELKL